MLLSSALVAGAVAFQASAFLVPLEVSKAAEAAKGQIESIWSTSTQIYDLDCPGCPFAGVKEAEWTWEEDVENKIHLEFSVDRERGPLINGRTLIPTNLDPSNLITLDAPQIRVADSAYTTPIPLGFALEILPPVTNAAEPGKQLRRLQFTILDLNGVPVEVDTLKIDVLEVTSESGRDVSIVNITPIPFDETPGAECPNNAKWSLCRLRAIVTARLRSMMEAAKARAHKASSWMKKGGCHGKKAGKHGHVKGQGRPHHGHIKIHRMHRFGHMLHQALRFFIIPALLGIIGGLMASAVGMLVGQFIVYMWFRFHRNGQRGQIRIVEVAVFDDEKDALVGGDAMPPQYEDIEAVIINDEKH